MRDPNTLSRHAVTQNSLQTHGGFEAEGKHLLRFSSGSAWSLSQTDYKTTGWASGPGEHEPEYIESVAERCFNIMWRGLYWLPRQTLTVRRRLEEAFDLPWIESHLKLAIGPIIGIGCVSSSWTLLWVCEAYRDVWRLCFPVDCYWNSTGDCGVYGLVYLLRQWVFISISLHLFPSLSMILSSGRLLNVIKLYNILRYISFRLRNGLNWSTLRYASPS